MVLPPFHPRSKVVLLGKWHSAGVRQCPWSSLTWMIFILMFKLFTCHQITSLLQPMDQGVIANFKNYTRGTYRMASKTVEIDSEMTLRDYWKSYNILNCIKNIDAAWREVSEVKINAVWRPLCPQFVNEFKGFDLEENTKNILTSLVGLSEKLNLELEEEDFEGLMDFHGES